MRRAPVGRYTQRKGAAVRIPHHAAGRLGGQHPDAVEVLEQARAARSAGLLVGHEVQHDATGCVPERDHRVDHRRQAALHVGGAAAVQAVAVDVRLELRAVLSRDDVVVAVEVQRPIALADARLQDLLGDPARLEVEPVEFGLEQRDALGVVAAGRVLARDRDEPLGQVDDGVHPPWIHHPALGSRESIRNGPYGRRPSSGRRNRSCTGRHASSSSSRRSGR